MQHTVIGLAGHIDHGKTALIRALTGIETDRLPEEKKRGITIDIGFAYWKDNITIIDVPGHEKFIKNMVAGVSTVNLFLLVIAADDGVMRQTREHLEILKFFNVHQGLAVITKTDLVDREWLDLIENDVRSFLDEEGYQKIALLKASATTGEGIEEVRGHLLKLAETVKHADGNQPFRLNIDRSFYSKGFGNVITGTVLSGSVKTEQEIEVLPEGLPCRVRGLQVHQKSTAQVHKGQRAAINLNVPGKQQLQRGQVLVQSGSLKSCTALWAQIKTTGMFSFKIKRFAKVRLHVGTAEVSGTINWRGNDPFLQMNKPYFLKIKLSVPVVAAPGDALLLRSLSPVTTIAGGRVLMIDPPELKNNDPAWPDVENIFVAEDLQARVKWFIELSGYRSFELADIARHFFIQQPAIERLLEKMIKQKFLIRVDNGPAIFYLAVHSIDRFGELLISILETAFRRQNALTGFNFAEIQALVKKHTTDAVFLKHVLQKLNNREVLAFDGRTWLPPSAKESFRLGELKKRIGQHYLKAGYVVQDAKALGTEFDLSAKELANILRELLHERILISIGSVYYLHQQNFDRLLQFLREHFARHETLKVSDIRDFTGSTRKFLIPLLEYLDIESYTERTGDLRRRGGAL